MSPEELVMQQFALSLARIEGKLDDLIKATGDHETRLRTVEAGYVTRGAMYRAMTALTGLVGVTVALVSLLTR